MSRSRLAVLASLLLVLFLVPVEAAQLVTLDSGAVLVGEVSMEGDQIAIDIDGATVRVSIQEVATITPMIMPAKTPTDGVAPGRALRLLLIALESRVLRTDDGQEPGLLAEAYHLEPDDTRIAFWYAFSLEAAGYGAAAEEVLDRSREEIAAAYPGIAQRLFKRVLRRVELERLPDGLVRRSGATVWCDGSIS